MNLPTPQTPRRKLQSVCAQGRRVPDEAPAIAGELDYTQTRGCSGVFATEPAAGPLALQACPMCRQRCRQGSEKALEDRSQAVQLEVGEKLLSVKDTSGALRVYMSIFEKILDV